MHHRESADQEAVKHVVRQINEFWLGKKYDKIGELVSENVIIAPPGFNGRVYSREAYVQSYRDYDQMATTHEYSPGEPEIDIIGNVAVAVFSFLVAYELKGKTYREQGHDVLVLSRTAGEWRVIWRTMQTKSVEKDAG
jgi:hypothetical protein